MKTSSLRALHESWNCCRVRGKVVVMSTTLGAGMTHRMCFWAAKNRLLSFLLGPEADQLVISFRTRLSGHCLLLAEVNRPHLPVPTFPPSRCKPLPAPTTCWLLLADLLVTL